MPTTVSLKLVNIPGKDGTCPVKLCIIKNRKDKYINTPFRCHPKNWDRAAGRYTSHPEKLLMNSRLKSLEGMASAAAEKADLEHPHADVARARDLIRRTLDGPVSDKSIDRADFYAIFAAHIDSKGNFFTADHMNTTLAILKKFRPELKVGELDYSFCKSFETWALTVPYRADRLRKPSTVHGYLQDVATVWNETKKRVKGSDKVWMATNYPFDEYKPPKATKSKKVTFGDNPMDTLRAAVVSERSRVLARDVFLFQYNMLGMRISDVLNIEWDEIYDGYVHYDMNKNGKVKKYPISDEASAILDRYRGGRTKYVFPLLQPGYTAKDHKNATRRINEGIKKLCDEVGLPRITSHGARRSIGWKLRREGVAVDDIQDFYGHADKSTTKSYLDGIETNMADEVVTRILNKRK